MYVLSLRPLNQMVWPPFPWTLEHQEGGKGEMIPGLEYFRWYLHIQLLQVYMQIYLRNKTRILQPLQYILMVSKSTKWP